MSTDAGYGKPLMSEAQTLQLAQRYENQHGATVMTPVTPFYDTDELIVLKTFADKYHLTTAGQLKGLGPLKLGDYPPEETRYEGYDAGRPHVTEHGPDASVGQDRVERGGEVRSAVADHELDPMCLVAEVHEEVAGLLSGPLPGGMQRDAEDADAPGRVFYYGQDVAMGAVEQVDREEVARQDRVGLGAQKL